MRRWLSLLLLLAPVYVASQIYPERPPPPPDPQIPITLETIILNVDDIPPADANTVALGSWLRSSGSLGYPNNCTNCSVYGSFNPPDTTATFEFRFPQLQADLYTFCAWWTSHPNRSDNVPHRLFDAPTAGGTSVANYTADQNLNAGQWVKLFDYEPTSGSATVQVQNVTPPAIADAVMATNDPNVAATCVDIPTGPPPPTSIDIIIDQDDPEVSYTPDMAAWEVVQSPVTAWNNDARSSGESQPVPATVVYTFPNVQAGTYDVCSWWPSGIGSDNVTYNVGSASSGNQDTTVNQSRDAGRWVEIDSITTTVQEDIEVKITVTSILAIADGMRLTDLPNQCAQPTNPPAVTGNNFLLIVDDDNDGVGDHRDLCLGTTANACVDDDGCQIPCPSAQYPTVDAFVLGESGHGIMRQMPSNTAFTNWSGYYRSGGDLTTWSWVQNAPRSMINEWNGGGWDFNNMRLWQTGGGHNGGGCNQLMYGDLNDLSNPFRNVIHCDNIVMEKCRLTQATGDNNATEICTGQYAGGTVDWCDIERSTWWSDVIYNGCTHTVLDANNLRVNCPGQNAELAERYAIGREFRVHNPGADSFTARSFGYITAATVPSGDQIDVTVGSWNINDAGGFQLGWENSIRVNPLNMEIDYGPLSQHYYNNLIYIPGQDVLIYNGRNSSGPNACPNNPPSYTRPGLWVAEDVSTSNPRWVNNTHITSLVGGLSHDSPWIATNRGSLRASLQYMESRNELFWLSPEDGTGLVDVSDVKNWNTRNCNSLDAIPDDCPVTRLSTQDNQAYSSKAIWAMAYDEANDRIYARGRKRLQAWDPNTGLRIGEDIFDQIDSERCGLSMDTQVTNDLIMHCDLGFDRTVRVEASADVETSATYTYNYPNGRFPDSGENFFPSALLKNRGFVPKNRDYFFAWPSAQREWLAMRMPRDEQWIPKLVHSGLKDVFHQGTGNKQQLGGMDKTATIAHLGDALLTYDTIESVTTGPRVPVPDGNNATQCNGNLYDCTGGWRYPQPGSSNPSVFDSDFLLDPEHPSQVGDLANGQGPQAVGWSVFHIDPTFGLQKNVADITSRDAGFFFTLTTYIECNTVWMGPGGATEYGCEVDNSVPPRPDGTPREKPIAGAQRRSWQTTTGTTSVAKYVIINTGTQVGNGTSGVRACAERDPQIVFNIGGNRILNGWHGCPQGRGSNQENFQFRKSDSRWDYQPGGVITNVSDGVCGNLNSIVVAGNHDFNADPDCFQHPWEEWFTIQVEVSLGEWEFDRYKVPRLSYIKAWIAREFDQGKTPDLDEREFQMFMNWDLDISPPTDEKLAVNPDAGFSAVYITQQQTNRTGTPDPAWVQQGPQRVWHTRVIWSDRFVPRPEWPAEQ